MMVGINSRIAVTAFNHDGYGQYGDAMINSFLQFWPSDVNLIVVSDDQLPLQVHDRVELRNYASLVPEGERFRRKFFQFTYACGLVIGEPMQESYVPDRRMNDAIKPLNPSDRFGVPSDTIPMKYDCRFDAVRHAQKLFSLFGVAREYDADQFYWIDGDICTNSMIDEHFFNDTNPGSSYLTYLGGGENQSGYEFLVLNARHDIHEEFLPKIVAEYVNGEVFLLPEWHDSCILRAHIAHYENKSDVTYQNLQNAPNDITHCFPGPAFNKYMDRIPHWKNTHETHDDRVSGCRQNRVPEISVIQNISKIQLHPYPHIGVQDALPDHVYRELEANLPINRVKSEGKYSIGGTSGDGGNFRYLAAAALSDQQMPSIWQEFFEYHTSAEYFRAVISLFEPFLEDNYPEYLDFLVSERVDVRGLGHQSNLVTDCQYVIHEPLEDDKTTRTPHLDNPIEIYAGLLYMKSINDESEGGNFSIHEFDGSSLEINRAAGREVMASAHNMVAEIPYQRNSFAMFLNVHNSIHSVTPRRNAKLDRISINIIGEFNNNYRMWSES